MARQMVAAHYRKYRRTFGQLRCGMCMQDTLQTLEVSQTESASAQAYRWCLQLRRLLPQRLQRQNPSSPSQTRMEKSAGQRTLHTLIVNVLSATSAGTSDELAPA